VIANLSHNAPLLREALILPGCGHWTQQERPKEVNSALIGFLKNIA
jgi:pimeloyl-ACP methyl ester carboxylesterase